MRGHVRSLFGNLGKVGGEGRGGEDRQGRVELVLGGPACSSLVADGKSWCIGASVILWSTNRKGERRTRIGLEGIFAYDSHEIVDRAS